VLEPIGATSLVGLGTSIARAAPLRVVGTANATSTTNAVGTLVVLAAPGCSWLLLAASGCSWLSWLLLAAPGCSWLLLAASGCSWLSWLLLMA
jgi:hypothetical protein